MYQDGKLTPMRLGARLGYSNVSANFLQEQEIANTENTTATGTTKVISHHILETSISQINLTPYFAYSIIDNLVANVGLNLGFVMSGKYNKREELASPD